MNEDWSLPWLTRRDILASEVFEADWWSREAEHQQQEAARWQRRVELAERHQESDLATQAAQRARRHAGLALVAAAQASNEDHEMQQGSQESRLVRITIDQASAVATMSAAPNGA